MVELHQRWDPFSGTSTCLEAERLRSGPLVGTSGRTALRKDSAPDLSLVCLEALFGPGGIYVRFRKSRLTPATKRVVLPPTRSERVVKPEQQRD